MAEAIAKSVAHREDIRFTSAGLHCHRGAGASRFALMAAAECGIDLSRHRSRPMTDNLAFSAWKVVAMTSSLADEFRASFPHAADKVATIADGDVPDPFGSSLDEYRACFDFLAKAVPITIQNLC